MKNSLILIAILASISFWSCKESKTKPEEMKPNILIEAFNTPYGVPPFNEIKLDDYLPAFEIAMAKKREEIKSIATNQNPPTFQNTVEALERSGELLQKVEMVFNNLLASNTSAEMQALAEQILPLTTTLNDEILMNQELFARVKAVKESADTASLNEEQKMLLKKMYKGFIRGGANLNAEQKARLMEINKELGLVSLSFGNNVLNETNRFEAVVEDSTQLKGLPQSVIDAAASTAKEKGKAGKWIFTIQKSSLIPVLTYAENRELREKVYKAYITKGDHNDSLDNKANIVKLVNLRLEKAKLLGFANWAAYSLEESMAKTTANAFELVNGIMAKANARSKVELKELKKIAALEGNKDKFEAWDWWFYAEKLRKAKYDLSEEEMRPYFQLEKVRDGMFRLATKLYNVEFALNSNLPLMDPLAEAYEVKRNGNVIAILYMDYYPRESKEGGAWMTEYRGQERTAEGENIIPVVSLTCNFTPASGNTPSLLNVDEVETLFHEFGHGLHGMLSNVTYGSLSGTNVPRDFVELPSQIMENWAMEPEFLKTYAVHYQTGEVIPDALIAKMKKSSTFNNGFTVGEFVAAAALDMAWHSIETPFQGDVNAFEKQFLTQAGLIDEIAVRYRSTYYNHIFAGGYSAGYYSYLWTAVLDADAFGAFQETSLTDSVTATRFYTEVLSRGGTREPEVMWKNFRGREPKMEFYLRRQGL
jgi:peptidyl-dipeptidase Dcp